MKRRNDNVVRTECRNHLACHHIPVEHSRLGYHFRQSLAVNGNGKVRRRREIADVSDGMIVVDTQDRETRIIGSGRSQIQLIFLIRSHTNVRVHAGLSHHTGRVEILRRLHLELIFRSRSSRIWKMECLHRKSIGYVRHTDILTLTAVEEITPCCIARHIYESLLHVLPLTEDRRSARLRDRSHTARTGTGTDESEHGRIFVSDTSLLCKSNLTEIAVYIEEILPEAAPYAHLGCSVPSIDRVVL